MGRWWELGDGDCGGCGRGFGGIETPRGVRKAYLCETNATKESWRSGICWDLFGLSPSEN